MHLFLIKKFNQFFLILFRYVILNVQKEVDPDSNQTKYIYKEVGNWNNDNKLDLDVNAIIFPDKSVEFKSICSEQCGFGHVKVKNLA